MKNKLLIGIGLVFTGLTHAQSLERMVFSSGGNTGITTGVVLDYTLGETFAVTLSSGALALTAGFQQPTSSGVSLNETSHLVNRVQAYPNPCSEVLNIFVNIQSSGEGRIQLTDITGRLIYSAIVSQEQLMESLWHIPVRNYEPGTYLLSILLKEGGRFTVAHTQQIQFLK